MDEHQSTQERPERVELLKSKLKEFASSNTQTRERMLKDLFGLIKGTLTDPFMAELLVPNGETQIRLRRATESAFETPFKVNGEDQTIWESGYTVASLNQEGAVLGIISKPSPALKGYGYLGRFALSKAVCELHLDKADKKGGLSNLDNFDYISDIGLIPFQDLFTGSYPGLVDFGYGTSYLGGSGCAVKENYLKDLLAGALPTADTLAGTFDAEFCKLTALYLSNPGTKPSSVPEPNVARMIRIQN